MNFDKVLQLIGGFGRFQKTLYVWICLPQIFLAFHMLVSIFTGAVPPHLCRPSTSSSSGLLNAPLNFTQGLQVDASCSVANQSGGAEAVGGAAAPGSSSSSSSSSCPGGWEYSSEVFHSTIVTEWDLVCDRASLNNIGSSIYMFGLLVGAVGFGSLADKYGRRPVVLASLAIQAVFGVGAAFAPNFYVYTALRFLVGTSISGVIMNVFVLGTEWTGLKQRMLAGIITDYFFGVGYILLAGLAYLIRDWRHLQLAISAPGFLFITYVWLLPRSARWLLANNQKEEAWRLIQQAARTNGLVNTKDLELLRTCSLEEKPEAAARKHSFLDLVRTPRMRRHSLIVFYLWFANVFVYYGLSLNISDFGMNIYLTQMIFGLVEMPARTITLFTLNRSRKMSQLAFLAVGGGACLLTIFVPADLPAVRTTLAMIGKFGITASLSIIYVYSAEIFPTVIRQNGIGLGSMCARVGGVLAPMLHFLRTVSPLAPMVLCGLCPLLGSALTLMLPETANQHLPDTVEDVEGPDLSEDGGDVKAPVMVLVSSPQGGGASPQGGVVSPQGCVARTE